MLCDNFVFMAFLLFGSWLMWFCFFSRFSGSCLCYVWWDKKQMSGCGDVVLWEGSWRGWVENCGGSCWGWLMVTPRSIGLLGSGLAMWWGILSRGWAMGVFWPGERGLPRWGYVYFEAKRLEAKRTSRKWMVGVYFFGLQVPAGFPPSLFWSCMGFWLCFFCVL